MYLQETFLTHNCFQFLPGQSGGQAISNVLFGLANPRGRVPISVPYSVGTLYAFYKYVLRPPLRE